MSASSVRQDAVNRPYLIWQRDLTPSKGTVKVFGEELVGLNKRAGYMFQAEALMPWRTAIDNVSAGLQFKGVPEKERMNKPVIGSRAWV